MVDGDMNGDSPMAISRDLRSERELLRFFFGIELVFGDTASAIETKPPGELPWVRMEEASCDLGRDSSVDAKATARSCILLGLTGVVRTSVSLLFALCSVPRVIAGG